MQASRATSRALKAVASGKQIRSLHVTGSATYSNLLNSERRALNFPRDIAGLQAECQKRKLPIVGSENELLNRLTAHEMAASRAYSTLNRDSKRPTPSSTSTSTPARHFNTSRSLKAVNDTSTIDFAFIPDFDPDSPNAPIVRVPILPQTNLAEEAKVHTAADLEVDSVLPTIDAPTIIYGAGEELQSLAASFANKFSAPADSKNYGMARELWTEFVKDILGSKDQGHSRA